MKTEPTTIERDQLDTVIGSWGPMTPGTAMLQMMSGPFRAMRYTNPGAWWAMKMAAYMRHAPFMRDPYSARLHTGYVDALYGF